MPQALQLILTTAELDQLRELVTTRGELEAMRQLGLSRQTIARLLAGLPTRRGSVAQLRLRLRELAEAA